MEENRIPGADGQVHVRLREADRSGVAVLMVGGIGGGFDSPAGGLYDRLFADLPAIGMTTMRVRFRRPGDLAAATADVLTGVDELGRRGVGRVALVGHSFGGAVVIRAGVRSDRVTAVCTMSAQGYGTDEAGLLPPRPVLAIHGTEDPVLPASCSMDIVRRAGGTAQLELVAGAGHTFDAEANAVHDMVQSWLLDVLRNDNEPRQGRG